jgi:hypothetical protein
MQRIVLMLVLLAFVLPARGQQPGNASEAAGVGAQLKELFAGSAYPLTMKLKDLNGEWRRFAVGGQFEMGNWMQMFSSMLGGGAGGGAYYSKGQTVTLGSEVYIVAYRAPAKPMDWAALMQAGAGAKPPTPEKLTPDTTLSLSLVNLRTSGSLNDIRPFDMQQEIAESETAPKGLFEAATEKATETASVSNLKQMGLALMMYVQDYDEVFPPMKDPATVKKLLMPYVKNESVFVDPISKKPYQPNPILSRKKMAHIASPASFVAIYETEPAADGTRGVCFLDGRVKRVPESEWPQLKRASKIP